MEKLSEPERGYRLTSPSKLWVYLGEGLEPTILVDDRFLVLADTPARARAAHEAATGRAKSWVPDGEVKRALEGLPAELTSITIGDPACSTWPANLARLPKLVQYVVSVHNAFGGEPPKLSSPGLGLGLLGMPRPGEFRLKLDPDQLPKEEDVRAHLFPSVLATSVDDRGLRLTAREALPLSCADLRNSYSNDSKKGERISLWLRPFLFPSVPIWFETNLTTRRFTAGMGWKSIPSKKAVNPK
jgi:hypothetical protein